jgi:hypothetical protein
MFLKTKIFSNTHTPSDIKNLLNPHYRYPNGIKINTTSPTMVTTSTLIVARHTYSTYKVHDVVGHTLLRAALHLEAKPIPLEVDCMKFQPLLDWRLTSTKHYNKIITGANFPICKDIMAKKPC